MLTEVLEAAGAAVAAEVFAVADFDSLAVNATEEERKLNF